METTVLGRTGLRVSIAGLGAGGHSRLGLARGGTPEEAVRVVHAALDLGVNLVDTAIAYGTEEVVGRALEGRREGAVVTSKVPLKVDDGGKPGFSGRRLAPADVRGFVEGSLRRLRTDRIDVFFLHGVAPEEYTHARDALAPALLDLRSEGKIRFLGLAERFMSDTAHTMLAEAVADDVWDVALIGYNMLNFSADRVLPGLKRHGVGVLGAFAVRKALINRANAAATVAKLVAAGEVAAGEVDPADPFGFLVGDGGATSHTEAAYRFARHAPGIDVVLTGTGSVAHLRENLASIAAPPLPPGPEAEVRRIFARVASVSGD